MILNGDDTQIEQFINAMHRPTDVLLNCEKCARLYYADLKISQKRFDAGTPLLCTRCRREMLLNK